MDYLKINGAFGEGGGQIVRTALTLSCITGQPIILENIRKNRKVEGLKSQHVTAIRILEKLCDAEVEGVRVGSTAIKFSPGRVKDAILSEDIGTAGSIPLVLQVVIPICAICNVNLDLTITGGTDGKWSPTTNYTLYVLSEAYSRMGIKFSLDIIKRGYYPKGGGKIRLKVFPSKKIQPIVLGKRSTSSAKVVCSFSKISREKIQQEMESLKERLTENGFTVDTQVVEEEAFDSGASVIIFGIDSQSIIGVDSLYEPKQNSFDKRIVQRFLDSGFSVDEKLADMLVVPASLSDGMTVFQVGRISKHLETNLYVTSKITGCRYGVGKVEGGFEIRIEGISDPCIH